MRIVVEAPGWAGTLCAPREMLVERVLKLDDVGAVNSLLLSAGVNNKYTTRGEPGVLWTTVGGRAVRDARGAHGGVC